MSLVNEQQGSPSREARESAKGGSISVKDEEIFEERDGSEAAMDKEQDGSPSLLALERETNPALEAHMTDVYGLGGFHPFARVLDWSIVRFYPQFAEETNAEYTSLERVYQGIRNTYGRFVGAKLPVSIGESGLGYATRRWGYIGAMIIGLALEIIGYAARVQLNNNPFDGDSFLMWMFLLEGAPVLLGGVATIFVLPDYPNDKAKFLSQEDRELIVSELPENQPTADSKTWDWSQVKLLACNPVFYLFILIWTSHCIGSFSVAMVLPTVFYALKLENSKITQLLTLPPYAIGILVVLVIATQISKRKVNAWKCAIILEMINCGCYVALLVVGNAVAKYVLVCFAIVCASGVIPILLPELIGTSSGTTATALTIGIVCCFAHSASIAGPQVYRDGYGPHYRLSFSVSLGLLAIAIAAMLVNWMLIRRRDVKAKAATTKAGQ
ncbi:hypothetical protein LTR10_009947 [Elasticomyces elasticus]|nr:hypothetical protein LTR10_009947 [Elasticomyces elasticus]KAK4970239.1 hypothetical protein LTR42_008406 [Elasticomyces elasticus]